MPATAAITEFFGDIADEMVNLFNITRAEAIARINAHWDGQEFTGKHGDLIQHEDDHFWAMQIYYLDVPDWDPNADRSAWTPVPRPQDPRFWTTS